LHIEGLGFPMKARVQDASRKQLTVGNELGFLQVGKQLELEDAETGEKRPASIDRVEVEIDPESKVPRLVVGLRYDDEPESIPVQAEAEPRKDSTPEPSVMDKEEEGDLPAEDAYAAEEMKSPLARKAAKVTPAIMDFAKRAKTAAGVLWEKRRQRARERAEATKRTTAPAPGGGLHAAGRKVVRATDLVTPQKARMDMKRKIAVGAAAGLAVVLAFAALHKPAKTEVAQPEKPVATDATAAAVAPPPPPIQQPPPPPIDMPPPVEAPEAADHHAHHGVVAPFGNGSVTHGNVLKLKMDGAIDKINGAAQPTGFTVSVPGRRALEPAGPLASRDSRIASIKVTNEGSGSQLDVAFKDGVPNYVVRAKGDTLELVLAAPGRVDGDDRVASRKKPHAKK
jgi:hypothetical protein